MQCEVHVYTISLKHTHLSNSIALCLVCMHDCVPASSLSPHLVQHNTTQQQDPARGKYLVREALQPYMNMGGVRIESNVLITADGRWVCPGWLCGVVSLCGCCVEVLSGQHPHSHACQATIVVCVSLLSM